jgi:NADPH-dependent glutamate synthase beta subunit-like oxidoreductase
MAEPTLKVRKDPYVGYEPRRVARAAAACLACGEDAACMQVCKQGVDIQGIVGLAGKAACEALALPRWFMDREAVEAARITDAICSSYNT